MKQNISPFLSINTDIDLKTADLFSSEKLDQYNWPEDADRKELLQSLRIRQRLLKVYPDESVATVLESVGIHSAHHIASVGANKFAEIVLPQLNTLQHIEDPKALSAKIVSNADRIRRASFELALARPRTMELAVQAVPASESLPHFQEGVPDYESLFGPMITCDCKECQSIFGPAAYFTDLMRVVSQYVTPPLEELFQLQYRRPDLWTIPLDCLHADTEVSYIDIVNSVLKQNLETNYTSGNDALLVAAAMVYPFSAPYNAELLTVREGLKHTGTSLAKLYELLGVPALSTAIEMLNLSPEQASIISGEPNVTLQELYGIYDENIQDADLCDLLSEQKTFLQQTGLTPEELESLVYQNLKQGSGEGNEMNSELLQNLFLNKVQQNGAYIVLKDKTQTGTGGEHSYNEASIQLAQPSSTNDSITYSSLNDAALRQLAIYIRLQKQTGWTYEELDWVLISLTYNTTIDAGVITDLGKVAAIKNKYDIPLDELCNNWFVMKTYGRGNEALPADLYDRVYNTPPLLANSTDSGSMYYRPTIDPTGLGQNPLFTSSYIYWSFNDTTDSQNQRISNQLAAALNISTNDLAAVVDFVVDGADNLTLNLSHLSLLYRVVRLAKMVNIKVTDFVELCTASHIGINVNDNRLDLDKLINVCRIAEWFKRSKLSISQLKYLTSNTQPATNLKLVDAATINKAIEDMQSSASDVRVTESSFTSDRVDATTSQEIYNRLVSTDVINSDGIAQLKRDNVDGIYLNPQVIYDALVQDGPFTQSNISNAFVQFDGSSESNALFSFDPFANDIIHTTNSFTISMWVRPDDISVQNLTRIIGYNEGNDNSTQSPSISQSQSTSGSIVLSTGYDNNYYSAEVANVFQNTTDWIYLTWVNDEGNWQLYRNGVAVPFTEPLNNVPGIYTEVNSGAYELGGSFSGAICDVSIWNRSRTVDEIQSDMKRDIYTDQPGLLAWWPMNEGTGTTIYNQSGNSEATNGELSGPYSWYYTESIYGMALSASVCQQLIQFYNAQNTLVVKTLAGVAGTSSEVMSGVCELTSLEVNNADIFIGSNYQPDTYPYLPNMLLSQSSNSSSVTQNYLTMLQRNTALAKWFRLTGAEAGSIAPYSKTFGDGGIEYGMLYYSVEHLMLLSDYKSLQKLCNKTNGLITYFKDANANSKIPTGEQLELLAELTGWNQYELTAIVNETYFSEVNFNTIHGLMRLAEVMAAEQQTGLAILSLDLLRGLYDQNLLSTSVDTTAYWQQYTNASASATAMVSSKTGVAASDKLAAGLREQTRTVLSDWLIWALSEGIGGVTNMQELYEYLLIDVNMSANVKTSQMVTAMNSLQLYVNRIINNLEPGAVNNIPEIWWEWMSTYRVWQANREVYLYPENYVDPTLRKLQSSQFKDFINDASKGQITDDNVKAAMATYLEAAEEVSNLKVVDVYVDKPKEGKAGLNPDNNKNVYFLIGKSHTDPATYYSRVAVSVTSESAVDANMPIQDATSLNFGPWQKINLQINSEYVSTVSAFGRQFIFWIEQTQVTNTDSNSKKYTAVYATIYYSYRDFSDKWTEPIILKKDVLVQVFGKDIHIDYYTEWLQGTWLAASLQSSSNKIYLYYKTMPWNKVGLQVLPASRTREEQILVTFGDMVYCPESITSKPSAPTINGMVEEAAKLQSELYHAAKFALSVSPNATTIIPAITISSSFHKKQYYTYFSANDAQFVNYTGYKNNDEYDVSFFTSHSPFDSIYNSPVPLCQYPMTENMDMVNAGNLIDIIGQNNGSLNFSPTFSTIEAPFHSGLKPVNYNGSNSSYGTIPASEYIGLTEFTVSFWVYLNNTNDQNIVSLLYSSIIVPVGYIEPFEQGGWCIYVNNGRLYFSFGKGDNTAGCTTNNYTCEDVYANKWMFLAIRVAGGHITVNVNDNGYSVSYAYHSVNFSITPSVDPVITLGSYSRADNGQAYNWGPGNLNGTIVGLKYWDECLSDKQLQQEYNSFAQSVFTPLSNNNLQRIGNSYSSFVYNRGTDAYLLLPTFQSTQTKDCIATSVQKDGQILLVRLKSSPVQETTPILQLIRINTDVLPEMIKTLATNGISGLLGNIEMQQLPEKAPSIMSSTEQLLPPKDSLMNFNGAFGIYFWEIFFYAPYFIAEKLHSSNKFKEAERWYQYIFDPTDNSSLTLDVDWYTDVLLQQNVAGYWPLNNVDESTNEFPGYVCQLEGSYSGLTSPDEASNVVFSPVPRKIWDFNPDDHPEILIDYSPALNPTEFTVAAWVKLDSVPGSENYTIVNSQDGAKGYHLFVTHNSSNQIQYVFNVVSDTQADDYVTAKTGAYDLSGGWVYVAGTFNGSELIIYLNGVQAASQSFSGDYIKNQSIQLSIGCGASGSKSQWYFDGCIADVVISNSALSAYDVMNAYNNYIGSGSAGSHWNFIPFRRINVESLFHILNGDAWQNSYLQPAEYYTASMQMAVYEYDPFDADAIARLRVNSWQKATFMRYVDNLISWGDSLFTQDTWETLSDATMRYVLASILLGSKPLKETVEEVQSSTNYDDIEEAYGAGNVPPFIIDLENAVSGTTAQSLPLPQQVQSIIDAYFCIPTNKQLLNYWELVADRLYKLQHGLTITGAPNVIPLYSAPIDPMSLIKAKADSNINDIASKIVPNVPAFRFSYMISQARNVVCEVVRLGNELLAALEKQDAERLSQMQEGYQLVLLNLTNQVKAAQVNQLQYIGEGLEASYENAEYVHNTYRDWMLFPIGPLEGLSLLLSSDAAISSGIATAMKAVASPAYLVPVIFGLADGGMSPGDALNTASVALEGSAHVTNSMAQIMQQSAQYVRRELEWDLQKNIAGNQMKEIKAQIKANEYALNAAKGEAVVNQAQIQQTQEVYDFLKTKFTNEELYQWLSGQLSTIYFQMYQLAWTLATGAQAALQYETNITDTYLNGAAWNSVYQGLTAGDALTLSLQQMENAYIARNNRKLQIRKTWSMRQNDPQALVALINEGNCRFDINELSYDLDFPGHYNRKIKSVSITIPAVVGPYQNIHATLTQTGNAVCVKADIDAVKYLLGVTTSAPEAGGTLRVNWNPNQEIAISTGINDAGVFQVNFNDEQYLPFEGTGAVSSWNLKIPQAANAFSLRSISDVIVTIDYTAEDGGSTFATEVTQQQPLINYQGYQYLSMRQLYNAAWFNFCNNPDGNVFSLPFELVEKMYPANLQQGSIMLGSDTGTIGLLPVFKEGTALSNDLAFWLIETNSEPNYWSAETGQVLISSDETPVSVPGKNNPWTIFANVPTELLIDGKIDPDKLQDIILIVPFEGILNWG